MGRLTDELNERVYLTPPDNEAEKFSVCDSCNEEIYYGDLYYLVSGFNYCESCGEYLFKKIAGEE